MNIVWGVLIPQEVLSSHWFGVFAGFVAINTLIYVVLSVAKLFPVIRFGKGRGGRNRRVAHRSIYPEGMSARDR